MAGRLRGAVPVSIYLVFEVVWWMIGILARVCFDFLFFVCMCVCVCVLVFIIILLELLVEK